MASLSQPWHGQSKMLCAMCWLRVSMDVFAKPGRRESNFLTGIRLIHFSHKGKNGLLTELQLACFELTPAGTQTLTTWWVGMGRRIWRVKSKNSLTEIDKDSLIEIKQTLCMEAKQNKEFIQCFSFAGRYLASSAFPAPNFLCTPSLLSSRAVWEKRKGLDAVQVLLNKKHCYVIHTVWLQIQNTAPNEVLWRTLTPSQQKTIQIKNNVRVCFGWRELIPWEES